MNALLRLRGTTIQTTVRADEDELINGFSLIESYKVLKKSEGKRQGILSAEITLSKWQARQIHDRYVLSIDEEYFKIKRPTERRLYEIARKFCGSQKIIFRISLVMRQNGLVLLLLMNIVIQKANVFEDDTGSYLVYQGGER